MNWIQKQRTWKRDELVEHVEYRMMEYMAMLGFSTKAIQRVIPMSENQINYRLHKSGIKRKDYRDGKSVLANQVIDRLDTIAQRKLVEHLERYLLKG